MKSIFLTGTAGSGKSSLCSALLSWYEDKSATVASVNLDPGVQELPYEPDIDIRDMLDISTVMQNYQLGPNGALIMAADLIATRMNDIQESLDSINPDYAIFDTPGQIELFAYRSSGPYIVDNLRSEGKTVLFLFDSTLVSTPSNFVSIALLAASIQTQTEGAADLHSVKEGSTGTKPEEGAHLVFQCEETGRCLDARFKDYIRARLARAT